VEAAVGAHQPVADALGGRQRGQVGLGSDQRQGAGRGVSGVGPKSALGVLATLTPTQIAHAVATEDDAPFRKVSGIGPKTAKLITVSLAGKVITPAGPASTSSTSDGALGTVTSSVIGALVGLGWNDRIAAQAVEGARGEASTEERSSVQALLRLALARLGPQRTGAGS